MKITQTRMNQPAIADSVNGLVLSFLSSFLENAWRSCPGVCTAVEEKKKGIGKQNTTQALFLHRRFLPAPTQRRDTKPW